MELKEFSETVIHVSPDNMQAVLIVSPVIKKCTVEDIVSLLKVQGVTQGIDKVAIAEMLENGNDGEEIIIAKGKAPVDGEDGRFDILFESEYSKGITDEMLGQINYKEMKMFESVREGQPLARYIPSKAGKFGFNIKGQLVNPKKGKELPPLKGRGISISEDRMVYTAAAAGRITYVPEEGRLEIGKVLTINGSVNGTVGNISFEGDVVVKGDVLSGYEIKATGDVQIEGNLERSNIICGGNLLVKEGVHGGNVTSINAGGDVYGKFFEYVKISARGNVTANYIMNSTIECNQFIKTVGSKAAIIGGNVYAFQGIVTNNLGNQVEIPTTAAIGINHKLVANYNEVCKQLQKKEFELATFTKAKRELMAKYSQAQLQESAMFDRIRLAVDVVSSAIEEYVVKKEEYEAMASDLLSREIVINGSIYPNVKLIIDMKELNVDAILKEVTFKANTEKVIAYRT